MQVCNKVFFIYSVEPFYQPKFASNFLNNCIIKTGVVAL